MVPAFSEEERLAQEKLTLGLYLTGHPITRYETEIAPFITERLGALQERFDRSAPPEVPGRKQDIRVVIAGLVVELRTRQNKNGKRMAFMTLDDRTGRIEVALFSEAYDRFRDLVMKDQLVVVEGVLGWDDFQGQLRLSTDNMMRIGEARARFAKRLQIRWENALPSWPLTLKTLLEPHIGGECPVFIERHLNEAKAVVQLADSWRIHPQEALIRMLEETFGEGTVRLRFD